MINSLFSLEHTVAKNYIKDYSHPYKIIPNLSKIISLILPTLDKEEYDFYENNIAISKSTTVDKSATLIGPLIIGHNCEIRHCAYIRGNVIIGNFCVIGNSCEIKDSLIFDNAQIPHFNYVGSSVVGYRAHLGAGVILSNLKSDKSNVKIENIDTGLRKFGSLLGDFCEIGCGCVLNPGTIVGKSSIIYPLSSIRGVIKENTIYKSSSSIVRRI
ncbi:MAG: UDP-N-acetylglucosamine pyrophosphorylase [Clostridia bacterium]|nr:UDP-N-acetylglucosamine pyrophosphorylase [Clostridia bacterium]